MQMIYLCAAAILFGAVPQPGVRELASPLPPEGVECVVLNKLSAADAERLLQQLLSQLKIRPQYRLAAFPLPSEKEPRLVCVRGRDADIAVIKKLIASMDEAAGRITPREKPYILRIELKEVKAEEMARRILEAARRANLPVRENDFFVYPPGATGCLFFIGAEELGPRVAELCKGLDRALPPTAADRAGAYLSGLVGETGKAFEGLCATVLSALIILLLHALLCRLPLVGEAYRRSVRLFWEKLFASFRGQDLAWEIIKAGAALGVAASARMAVEGADRREFVAAAREHAMSVAADYIRWRGIDAGSAEVRRLLEAALDSEYAARSGKDAV